MVKIVGHKGAAGYATENTIKSFRTAIEIGCDVVEMDVRLTKDKEVIVFHDDNVSKLTNGEGFISDMTINELKKLVYNDGEKIPTLQEVIDLCKNKIDFQIELKGENTPSYVNDLIILNGLENNVVITSFKVDLIREIRILNPRLKVGLLFRTEEIMNEIWDLMKSVPLDFFAPFSEMVTKEFVDKAHSLGKFVYAYRVNSKELGDRLINMGVDSIGTDFPKLFIEDKKRKIDGRQLI